MAKKVRGDIRVASRNDLAPSAGGRVVQVYLNVNMGKQHNGLSELVEDLGLDPKELSPGQYVVFVNNKQDKIKIFTANGVIGYIRDVKNFSLASLALIPQAFKGTARIDANSVLAEVFGGAKEEASVPDYQPVSRRRSYAVAR